MANPHGSRERRVSASLAGVDRDPNEAADEALAIFGLEGRADNTPDRLSGGEQQRVAIAAAAARRPRIVLADEPTGELDASNESLVLDTLRMLRDSFQSAIVLITHCGGGRRGVRSGGRDRRRQGGEMSSDATIRKARW